MMIRRMTTLDLEDVMDDTETVEQMDSLRDSLLREQEEVNTEARRIEGDVRSAGSHAYQTGEYSDPTWYRRASDALNHKKRRLREIGTELAALKSRRKKLHVETDSEERRIRLFCEVAAREFEKSDIEEIMSEVDAMIPPSTFDTLRSILKRGSES